MQAVGVTALTPAVIRGAVEWPPAEGPAVPRICLGTSPNTDEAAMRKLKQIGVDYVLMGGPRIPWQEAEIRAWWDG